MKLIRNWEELAEVPPSKTHRLDININMGCGWIVPLEGKFEYNYLSTHTFYGDKHKWSTEYLQKFGFDVKLVSWDDE